ncbi:hypothetical protein [Prochlorothrix hollandica]|uniref:hypothetical protein n=1 Tax=Prochlorothrix hollandica TaxID=1223 RepID=UPI003340D36A
MRKQILGNQDSTIHSAPTGALDVPRLAVALVSSEAPGFPVENIFGAQGGVGGKRWQAQDPGPQTLVLAFDHPQRITRVYLEIEETEVSRTQELTLSASRDGGQSYGEVVRQEYNFSPPGTTFQQENWQLNLDQVTHLRLWIKPDKGGGSALASCTTLALY